MLILALTLIAAGAYLVHSALYPWRTCPTCGGSERQHSGKAFRTCRKCGGTGQVRRLLARIVNR